MQSTIDLNPGLMDAYLSTCHGEELPFVRNMVFGDCADIREKMRSYMEMLCVSPESMAKFLDISEELLDGLVYEHWVTHPAIVERIRKAFAFTEDEMVIFLPKNHRKGTADYDPEKYVDRFSPKQHDIPADIKKEMEDDV